MKLFWNADNSTMTAASTPYSTPVQNDVFIVLQFSGVADLCSVGVIKRQCKSWGQNIPYPW